MNKNLIVISHQRSGTHLTIDSIRNNIPVYRKNNYMVLNDKIDEHSLFERLQSQHYKLVYFQRSRGYNYDNDITFSEFKAIIENPFSSPEPNIS